MSNELENLISLEKTVRPVEVNNLNDINAVRNAMEQISDYKGDSPVFYERFFMDKPLEDSIKNYQKENGLKVDGILEPKGETENSLNQLFRSMKSKVDATKALVGNYLEMHKHGLTNGDDFFHCKANYEAAKKSEESEKFSKLLGDKKEDFDYYKNQICNGFSASEAQKDKQHDLEVNAYGLQQGKKERLHPTGRTFIDVCQKYNKNKKIDTLYKDSMLKEY